jgi:hypothetical protein
MIARGGDVDARVASVDTVALSKGAEMSGFRQIADYIEGAALRREIVTAASA